MGVNGLSPIGAGHDLAVMLGEDEALTLECTQVRIQLPEVRFISVGIGTEDFDGSASFWHSSASSSSLSEKSRPASVMVYW